MAISIELKVGANAQQVLAGVRAELKSTADAARATGADMKKAVDVKDAAGRFQAVGVSAQQAFDKVKSGASSTSDWMQRMTKSADALVDAMAREDAIFARIHGPIQEYTKDLEALDNLLTKNQISTSQYAEQMRRLNQEYDKTQGNKVAVTPRAAPAGGGGGGIGSAVTSMLEGGSAIQSFANMFGPVGQAVGAVIEKMIELGKMAIEVGDAYIELTNRMQRFADAGHGTDKLIEDQLNLAGELHGSLGETAEVYAKLREGTDEMNLSYEETMRLTKTLGEEVEMSGKSFGDAGGLMTRLAFAMDNGGLKGRELKAIMREYPAIANTWTESLGKTRVELMHMADKGKLSIEDLIQATLKAGDAVDVQFGRRAETAAAAWQHFKDELSVTIGKMMQQTDLIPTLVSAIQSLGELVKEMAPAFDAWAKSIAMWMDVANASIETTKLLVDVSMPLKNLMQGDDTPEYVTKYEHDLEAVNNLHDSGVLSTEAYWKEVKKLDDTFAAAKNLKEHPNVEHDIQAAVDKSREAAKEFRDKMDELNPSVGGAKKALSDYKDVAIVAHNNVVALTGALRELQTEFDKKTEGKALGADAYKVELDKFADAQHALERKIADASVEEIRGKYGDAVADALKKTGEHTRGIEDAKAALDAHIISAKQYYDILKAMGGQESAVAKDLRELRQAHADYAIGMAQLNKMLGDGTVSIAEYVAVAEKLNKALGADSAEEKIKRDIELYDREAKAAAAAREAAKYGIESGQYSSSAEGKSDMLNDIAVAKRADAYATKLQDDEDKERLRLMGEHSSKSDKYRDEILSLADAKRRGTVSDEEYSHWMQDIEDKYKSARTPAEAYAREVRQLNKDEAEGFVTGEAYKQKLAEITDKYAQHDEVKGFADGVKAITAQMDVAAQTQKVMVDGFNQLTTALTDFITKGTVDFRAMVQSMLVEMTKLLLFKAIMAAIGGSVPTPGAGGIAAAAGDLLPGHASGGSWQVGGSGGTDSQVVAFRASPDEHVTVETPAQRMQREATLRGQGDQAPVRIVNVHDQHSATLAAMNTVHGERIFMNWLVKNAPTIRGHIDRR